MDMEVKQTNVRVIGITDATTVGALATLAAKLGMTFVAARDEGEEAPTPATLSCAFQRDQYDDDPVDGTAEVLNLVLILAYVRGWDARRALHEIELGLTARRVPMDRPIRDIITTLGEG